MTATAFPEFTAALAAQFSRMLPDVSTTLGIHIDETPGTRIWVGCEDPLSEFTQAGRSEQSAATNRRGSRDEAGEVACVLLVERGDSDMSAALAAASEVLDAIAGWTSTDDLVAVSPWLFRVDFGPSVSWRFDQSEFGAGVMAQFTVGYAGRIHH